MAHHKLCVHQNVPTEDEGSSTTVYQFHGAVVREESRHETKQDQDPQTSKKVWHPGGEIVLGLASEKSQGNKDASRQYKSQEYDFGFIESNDDGDGISFQSGEATKEEQVCWIGLALPESKEHESDGSKE